MTNVCVHKTVLKIDVGSDMQYVKPTPTFHHCQTRQNRFGLTFQSSADASAFYRHVIRIVDLLNSRGTSGGELSSFIHLIF